MRITALLILLSCVPALAQQELLKNTSFEELDAKGIPAGWSRYGGGVPESQLKIEQPGRSGQNAVRFTDTGPNERDNRYAIGLQQDVPVTPGRFYLASVWAKAIARNHEQAVILQITFMGGEQKSFNTYLVPPLGGDWKRYAVGATAPEDAKTARLYLYTMHYWTSETLLDDASLKEAPAVSSDIAGAVFQWGREPLAGPRRLNLQTPLAKDGQPAAIITTPADPQWRQVAIDLQTAIQRQTGATLPIHLASVGNDPKKDTRGALNKLLQTDRTIIALGNLNNNFIIERLYFNGYTRADSLWPGAGNFALRTVHQPMNFGDINVLSIEASDAAGAEAATTELLKRLPESRDCALSEPLLVVSHVKPMTAEARQKLLSGTPSASLLLDFHRACASWRDTGDPAWADQARRLMLLCRDRLIKDPQYKLDWPEETTSNDIGKMWDVIEEAPGWTDAERADAENTLFATLIALRRNVFDWGSFANNDTIVWNHQTFPLLGVYWLARWFERHYPDQEPVAEYLAQVHGAFTGQLKSWKPQCDADSYLTITPKHTIEWSLSQNNYAFFESGNVRKFAEYLTGCSDNLGNIPGFGDSGYSKGLKYEVNGLPIAYWYYKDPRYLWRLQHLYDGKWPNPYDQAVQPKAWEEIQGVNVHLMPEEYYRWATTTPSYGEAIEKTDVSYDKSYDKISFREDLTPDSQYLLLDGFARGKHLQYDGNAIIKYHADGEDWLIDGDYLVRNTTDHTMISVVRDGRCDKLEPAFTSLDAHADLPTVGFIRTTVSDYNGADWSRNILWLKGEGFVVIDQLTARQDGDYSFENVFKMLDLGKLEFDGRVVKVSRPTAGGMGSRDLVPVANPEPGIAKAVRFANPSARLEFPMELPAGEYAVTLFGKGKDGGTDSFFLAVDDADPVACHIPIEKFGPSSAEWTKDVPTPNVKIARDGLHIFRVSLRENPGIMLQKVIIADKSGKELATIDAANPPPMPKDRLQAAPDACFYIKGDGLAQAAVTDRANNVNLRLKYLRHNFGGKLKAGQTVTDQVLFYNDFSDKPRNLDIRRVGSDGNKVLILRDGKPWGVFVVGGADAPLFFSSARLARLSGAKPSEGPVGNFPAAKLLADAARQAAAPSTAAGASALRTPPLRQLWTSPAVMLDGGDPAVINRFVPADLNGDGKPELLVARGNDCVAFDASGKQLWSVPTEARVNDMCLGDLNGDGKPELLIASDDEHIYMTDTSGKVLRKVHCDARLRVGTSSVRDPRVSNVAITDVDADGQPDIIVGTRNGNILRYSPDFVERWHYDRIPHGTLNIRLMDLNADGKLEIIAGNRYGSVQILDHKGAALPGGYSELGDVAFDVADLDGDGTPDILCGSSTGAFTCTPWRGKVAWRFDNYGYAVNHVQVCDLDGDGKREAAVASETGYVYLLNPDGSVKNMRNLGAPVLSMAVSGNRLIAGCRDGMLYVLDSALAPQQAIKLSGPVTHVTAADMGVPAIVAAGGEAISVLKP